MGFGLFVLCRIPFGNWPLKFVMATWILYEIFPFESGLFCRKDSLHHHHHHHHLLLFFGKQWKIWNGGCGFKKFKQKKSGTSSKFLLIWKVLEESWRFWLVTHLLFWCSLDWCSLCPREKERRDTGLIVIAALFTHQSWRFFSPHLQHQLWIFFWRQQHLLSSSPPPTILSCMLPLCGTTQ